MTLEKLILTLQGFIDDGVDKDAYVYFKDIEKGEMYYFSAAHAFLEETTDGDGVDVIISERYQQ